MGTGKTVFLFFLVILGYMITGLFGNFYYFVYYALFLLSIFTLHLKIRSRKSESFIEEYVRKEVILSLISSTLGVLLLTFSGVKDIIFHDYVIVIYFIFARLFLGSAVDIYYLSEKKNHLK